MKNIRRIIKEKGLGYVLKKAPKYIAYQIDRWQATKLKNFYYRNAHKAFYYEGIYANWMDSIICKNPFDLLIFAQIIRDVQPDYIIETGTFDGGSAKFYASILDQIGSGQVYTIDIEQRVKLDHPRITQFIGKSISAKIFNEITGIFDTFFQEDPPTVMVILDSDHSKANVFDEMMTWGWLVNPGSYMIVEDTNINGNPVKQSWGEGPMEAVEQYMREFPNQFRIDRSREIFPFTYNPKGFLKRIEGGQ